MLKESTEPRTRTRTRGPAPVASLRRSTLPLDRSEELERVGATCSLGGLVRPGRKWSWATRRPGGRDQRRTIFKITSPEPEPYLDPPASGRHPGLVRSLPGLTGETAPALVLLLVLVLVLAEDTVCLFHVPQKEPHLRNFVLDSSAKQLEISAKFSSPFSPS